MAHYWAKNILCKTENDAGKTQFLPNNTFSYFANYFANI